MKSDNPQQHSEKKKVGRTQRQRSYFERFMAMTDAEREKEVAQFDREFIADTFKPLTASDRARHRRAKRKGGRPTVGEGARRVFVSIEGGLLRRSDAFAKTHGMNRSEMIARGLEELMRRAS